jgi:predicted adenylyl cyclase CyaB
MEIEIRAVIEKPGAVKQVLREAGFVEEPPYTQHDIILDRPDASLFRSGRKIRIRQERATARITYKGLFQGDVSASRRLEVNVPVDPASVADLVTMFEAIGYPVCFQILKERTVFRGEAMEIAFDEWPVIGCLMEIEGPEAAARQLATRVAPGIEFRNYRLKELFRLAETRTGKTLEELKRDYEKRNSVSLGRIELLLD